jgi:hypothetical protein
MDTEERILAGEFLDRLGNRKSVFIIQLICDYLSAHPEAMNPKEAIKFIINTTAAGDALTEKIRAMIQSELAGKAAVQPPIESSPEQEIPEVDESGGSIDDMFGNLDIWNNM